MLRTFTWRFGATLLACSIACLALTAGSHPLWAQEETQPNPPEATPAAGKSLVDPLSLITVVPGGPPMRIPIAVPDAVSLAEADDPNEMGREIAAIIRRNFEISGLFEVPPIDTYGGLVDLQRDGMTTSSVNFDGWYMVGAAAVVKGTYRSDGTTVEIDLKLFDVDAGRQIKLNWTPSTARIGSHRRIVHDFVNAVIEHYTGERGVFGSRILYSAPGAGHTRRIQSMESDGGSISGYKVPEGLNILPTWGPANAILYTRLADEGDFAYLFQDGEESQITDFPGWSSGMDYCPSRGLLALTVSMGENPEIYTMKLDGSEVTRVTNLPDSIQTSPSWAPGCNQLAFVSDQSGRPQIYTVQADGTNMRRLTWVGNYNTTPEWSPKGDRVAFTARDERNVFDIFTVNTQNGDIIRLTQDQGHNEEPTWSPDGRYLVFQSTRDGRQPRLYIMSADGRWQTRLSENPGLRTPVWQR